MAATSSRVSNSFAERAIFLQRSSKYCKTSAVAFAASFSAKGAAASTASRASAASLEDATAFFRKSASSRSVLGDLQEPSRLRNSVPAVPVPATSTGGASEAVATAGVPLHKTSQGVPATTACTRSTSSAPRLLSAELSTSIARSDRHFTKPGADSAAWKVWRISVVSVNSRSSSSILLAIASANSVCWLQKSSDPCQISKICAKVSD
mmetsp:Transcript_42360/g.91947  ORF Transcript_42360/g.91947 Transcript_42360/m.91947 type:complete len:208 (+) Transcript_42360:1069-1692(+)